MYPIYKFKYCLFFPVIISIVALLIVNCISGFNTITDNNMLAEIEDESAFKELGFSRDTLSHKYKNIEVEDILILNLKGNPETKIMLLYSKGYSKAGGKSIISFNTLKGTISIENNDGNIKIRLSFPEPGEYYIKIIGSKEGKDFAITYIVKFKKGLSLAQFEEKVSMPVEILNEHIFEELGFSRSTLSHKYTSIAAEAILTITLKGNPEAEVRVSKFGDVTTYNHDITTRSAKLYNRIIIERDKENIIVTMAFPEPGIYPVEIELVNKAKPNYPAILEYNIQASKGITVSEFDQVFTSKKIEALLNYAEKGDLLGVKKLLETQMDNYMVNPYCDGIRMISEPYGIMMSPCELKPLIIDIDAADREGVTALMKACSNGHSDIVKYLLEKGAYLDDMDNENWTALMYTSAGGQTEIVKLLLDRGANASLKNKSGDTALKIAQKNKHTDIVKILKNAPVLLTNPLVEIAPGEWSGYCLVYDIVYYQELSIRKKGDKLEGTGLIALGRYDKVKGKKYIASQEYKVIITGEEMYLKGKGYQMTDDLFINFVLDPVIFRGRLSRDGFYTGKVDFKDNRDSLFYLKKKYQKPAVFNLEKGKVLKLTCLDNRQYHYNCYIPTTYNPSRPVPVLINDSPSGEAQPLSIKTAEELGWISVGLIKPLRNYNWQDELCNLVVIIDLHKRFNIDPDKWYFSGFSGGARNANWRGTLFQYNCAGLICIGQYGVGDREVFVPFSGFKGDFYPPLDIPMFVIFGRQDPRYGSTFVDTERQNGRKIEEIVHPYGHTWGGEEYHAAAMRWLAKQ